MLFANAFGRAVYFYGPLPTASAPAVAAAVFVGSKTFTHAATTPQACSLTNLLDSAGAIVTLQPDDFVILVYNTNTTAADLVLTPPVDWTQECDLFAADTSAVQMAVWTKFMGAVPDTTVSIPASQTAFFSTCVTVFAFRGVNKSSPYDVASVPATGNNDGKPNPAAITPVTPGALIFVAGAAAPGGSGVGVAFTNPGDLSAGTNEFKSAYRSATTQSGICGGGFKIWTAGSGAFDPATWGGGRTNSACSWAALTMALRPA